MSDDDSSVGEEDAFVVNNSTKEEDASMEKNSMEDSFYEICFAVTIISFILITGAAVISCMLLGDASRYIQDVYIPSLDTYTSTGSNGTAPFNASIFVDLKYHRVAATVSLDYLESELIVFYSHGTIPTAAYRIEAFSMSDETTVHKIAAMEAPELPWEEAIRAVSAGSTVELVVELRIARRNRHEYGYLGSAHVAVDASGHMVPKGPVVLRFITTY